MKIAESRDGRRRASVRLDFRLDFEDVVDLISRAARGNGLPTSRKKAVDMVRTELALFGSELETDDIYEPRGDVQKRVAELFPEFWGAA